MLCTIYKATNKINGKSYIGFDSNWPRRQIEHKSNAALARDATHFHKAIRKHGWDNFVWEIVCQFPDKNYTLKVLEPYFIKYYDTYENGYNLTHGGDGNPGYKWSTEMTEYMRKIMTGKKQSKETLKKKSLAAKGRKLSQDHILNTSIGLIKRYETENQEKILVNTKYGSVMFGSFRSAERSLKNGSKCDLHWCFRFYRKNDRLPPKLLNEGFIISVERVA
jgi:group I intron endonuclease